MKKYINKVLSALAFAAIVFAILLVLSYVIIPKGDVKNYGMESAVAKGVLAEADNTIDVIVIGDSEAYHAISPMQLWDEQGITSYVCATSQQKLYTAQNLLEGVLTTQKPKVVILETNEIFRELTYENSIASKAESTFAVFKFHDRWKELNIGGIFEESESTGEDNFKGFRHTKTKKGVKNRDLKHYMDYTDSVEHVSRVNKGYVRAIKKICDDNQIKLLLLSTPSTKNWDYYKHNGIAQLADELGVDYVDINILQNEVDIDWSQDTKDEGDHLNCYGAEKHTEFLGRYLKENYSLEDHRGDSNYSPWNTALEKYNKVLTG